MSSTERAKRPTWSSVRESWSMPWRGTSPCVGLSPYTPQYDAQAGSSSRWSGCRAPAAPSPAATAAAEPLEEPPGVCPALCGLPRLARRAGGELGRDRLAHDDRARGQRPRHHRRVARRRPARRAAAEAVLGEHVRGVDDVLEADRHAVQRPDRLSGRRDVRRRARAWASAYSGSRNVHACTCPSTSRIARQTRLHETRPT